MVHFSVSIALENQCPHGSTTLNPLISFNMCTLSKLANPNKYTDFHYTVPKKKKTAAAHPDQRVLLSKVPCRIFLKRIQSIPTKITHQVLQT